jgi:hypothetical protein
MNNTTSNLTTAPDAQAPASGKLRAAYMSLGMIGAVLWPVHENWRAEPHDNFPLSYYPMFSAKRKETETFHYMLGRDEAGNRFYLPYSFAGPGGLNSVRRQIRKITEEDRADELAHTLARKLRRKDEAPWSNIVTVAVVRGKFVVDDFFHGKKEPVSEQVKASCPVERRTL